MTESLSDALLKEWADDEAGPVALHLKQRLVPVEGEGGVIFPPTYADIGYNIDTLADGTKVATIDSVGSQANRMEPVFKTTFKDLVPQIEIALGNERTVSLLDLAHRAGDAVVRAAPGLNMAMAEAFEALKNSGDAGPLVTLAPTSLLFGVWDSRSSQEKHPRLVRSVIRAWDVEELHRSAQFNSIWKKLSEEDQADLKKEAKAKKVKLSEKGFADAPSGENPGGVVARGEIVRDMTINLVALRSIGGDTPERGGEIRRYLLGLALIAATADVALYLREGCFLKYADDSDDWRIVPRRGENQSVGLSSDEARKFLSVYADKAAGPFRKAWPKAPNYKFDIKEAKKLLAEEEAPT